MDIVQPQTVGIAFIFITFFRRRSSPSVSCMDGISGLLVFPNKHDSLLFFFYQLDSQILYFNTFVNSSTCFEHYYAHL